MNISPLRKARTRAHTFDLGVTAYDFKYHNRVMVHHGDGTFYNFNYAFWMKEGYWYYIFTEHHGVHVFAEDEVVVHAYDMDMG